MTTKTAASGGRGTGTDDLTHPVQTLLAATASRDSDLAGAIDQLGVADTARLLMDEILFRACLADLGHSADPASVTVVLSHHGQHVPTTVTVGPAGLEVHHRESGNPYGIPSPVVSQEMSETARALFGPLELVSGSTRSIRWPGPEVVFPTPDRPSMPTVFYAVVQRVIQVLDRGEPSDLSELAVRYGTDKWGSLHQYPRHYERHFGGRRHDRLTILEIGVGGSLEPSNSGASMRMWKRYFPRALIYGLDIHDKRQVDAARLTTIRADQSDPAALCRVAEQVGPFDIIIDDGSHISSHVITSFQTLFPYLRENGLYVIEDLQTCYWPEVYGGSDTDLNDPAYTVGFLKTLLDGLHHEEFLRADARAPQPTDAQISGVHVYHNLAVIEKGPNQEGSVVADVFRAARDGDTSQVPTLDSYQRLGGAGSEG